MDTLGLVTQYKVRYCSQCQGDTEFYRHTCKHEMCLLCKERYVIDLDTMFHDVVIYREKFKYIPRQEICVRHPDRIYEMFCQSCELSVCFQCLEHRKHRILDIRTAYQIKRQQQKDITKNIRSETLYNCRVILAGIQSDIQTCPLQIRHHQSQMTMKSQSLKDLIDTVIGDAKTRYRDLLIVRIQQQKRKMNRHLTRMQKFEDRYEQSANRVLQFLLFIKTRHVPQIKDTPNNPQHILLSLTEGLNMEDVNQLLRGIPDIEIAKGIRQVGIDESVKLTSTPVLHTLFCVKDVNHNVKHISSVISDRVWVSDRDNLIFTDPTGDTIHSVTGITPEYIKGGVHTVNNSGDLIYVDKKHNINKMSINSKTVVTLLENTTSPWVPRCVYYSPSTGDLIVGMCNTNTYSEGKIARYNSTGQHILTIHDTSNILFSDPRYITDNANGDIIVSEWYHRSIEVAKRGGRHRFTYTGPPSGSLLIPRGICTDTLSHILVCDRNTHTVQMIDKDGHFLSMLLTEKQYGIDIPYSLHYDDKTHLLWVGSAITNTVRVYKYIQRRYSLTDNPDGDEWTKSRKKTKNSGKLEENAPESCCQ